MKYKDVLYPSIEESARSIVIELERMLDNQDNDDTQEQYEFFKEVQDEISDVYLRSELGSICLHAIQEKISEEFSDGVEVTGWKLFVVLLSIGVLIEGEGEFELEEEISLSHTSFKLEEYEGNVLPFNAFAYVNQNNNERSIGYLKPGAEQLDVSNSGFSLELLAIFYYLFTKVEEKKLDAGYILYRSDALNQASAESTLKLLASYQGRVVHEEKIASSMVIPNSIIENVCSTNSYNQFDETLIILSEVNQTKSVLNKFLSIYHVIESFMFKIPLANLATKNNNRVFSIRDFRRLYESTSERELKSMENLFSKEEMGKFWDRDIGGQTFGKQISVRAKNLKNLPGFDTNECDQFLVDFGLESISSYIGLTNDLTAKTYARFLYKIRCAIVHNKETEFHISHFNLNDSLSKLIEQLLIQPLQLLISSLLADCQSKVWYTGPALNLYETPA